MRNKVLLFLFFWGSIAMAQDVKVLNLKPNDLVYLASTDRLYVSIPDGFENGNSLCVVNPYHGSVDTCYTIGDSPDVLAVSDDEKYIYIGLQNSPQVVRFDVNSHSIGKRFPLGSGEYPYGPYYAEDIAVLPGAPESIAVARKSTAILPGHAGVAIYDNGAIRPATTAVHTGSNSITFDPETGYLYGYNNETSEYGIRKMSVNEEGVFIESATTGLLDRYFDQIKWREGKLYSNFGKVISLADGVPALEATFEVGPTFPVVEPGIDTNVVFFLNRTDAAISFQTFDKNTRSFISELNFPNLLGMPYKLIQWQAGGGLAFIARDHFSGHHTRLVIMRNCTSAITESPVVERSGNACFGDTVRLYAQGPEGQVFWSNGQTGRVAEIDFTGAFFCAIADEEGCLGPTSPPLLVSFTQYPPDIEIYLSDGGHYLYASTGSDFGMQWFLNGEPIPGANSSTLYFTESGAYTAQIIWHECSSPVSNEISVVISGLGTPAGSGSYSLFPNPVSEALYLRASGGVPAAELIRIRSLDGRLLLEYPLQDGVELQSIPISSLAAGLYISEIFSAAGQRLLAEKMVKY